MHGKRRRGHKNGNGRKGRYDMAMTGAGFAPMPELGDHEALNITTGEIVAYSGTTPVALHYCKDFAVTSDSYCPFCNNGYRAPEQIKMTPSRRGWNPDTRNVGLECPHCGWVCTR